MYDNQARGTTAVYVNRICTEQFSGNDYRDEKTAIERAEASGAYMVERVVFGNGRVALIFRTK